MDRRVEAEWLDELAEEDERARGSRRDLRIINYLMGNERWVVRRVAGRGVQGLVVEMGAGAGCLGEKLVRAVGGIRWRGVDLAGRPEGLGRSLEWKQSDLREAAVYTGCAAVVGSLVLHHFEAGELERLGGVFSESSARHIWVVEPRRGELHSWQLRAGLLLGFNGITLHDGVVSVRAGFRGEELPELLRLADGGWEWRLEESWLGAYRLEAWR